MFSLWLPLAMGHCLLICLFLLFFFPAFGLELKHQLFQHLEPADLLAVTTLVFLLNVQLVNCKSRYSASIITEPIPHSKSLSTYLYILLVLFLWRTLINYLLFIYLFFKNLYIFIICLHWLEYRNYEGKDFYLSYSLFYYNT